MWRATYDVTRQVIDDLYEKNAGLISAGVAFYGLFAIFPGLAASISLFGLLADPTVVDSQLELMRGLMPPSVFRLFEIQIDGLLNAGSAMLGFTTLISIGLALWSARTGAATLIRGLNAIFDRPGHAGRRRMAHWVQNCFAIYDKAAVPVPRSPARALKKAHLGAVSRQ